MVCDAFKSMELWQQQVSAAILPPIIHVHIASCRCIALFLRMTTINAPTGSRIHEAAIRPWSHTPQCDSTSQSDPIDVKTSGDRRDEEATLIKLSKSRWGACPLLAAVRSMSSPRRGEEHVLSSPRWGACPLLAAVRSMSSPRRGAVWIWSDKLWHRVFSSSHVEPCKYLPCLFFFFFFFKSFGNNSH